MSGAIDDEDDDLERGTDKVVLTTDDLINKDESPHFGGNDLNSVQSLESQINKHSRNN
jgi:hypothetical protein